MTIETDLALPDKQGSELVFDAFSDDDAWQLGCRLRQAGAALGAPIVVDVRFFGRPLFFAALPGSVPDNVEWVRRKINTVQRFHRATYEIGLRLKRDNATLEAKYGLPLTDYAAHGGAVPLRVRQVGVVSVVTVSGLPQREDHGMVVRAMSETLGLSEAGLALP